MRISCSLILTVSIKTVLFIPLVILITRSWSIHFAEALILGNITGTITLPGTGWRILGRLMAIKKNNAIMDRTT